MSNALKKTKADHWKPIEILLVILLLLLITTRGHGQTVRDFPKWVKELTTTIILNTTVPKDTMNNVVLNGTAGKDPVQDMKLPAYPTMPTSTPSTNRTGIRQTIIFDTRGNSHLVTLIRL